jgi:protein O-mannosyl-transferase
MVSRSRRRKHLIETSAEAPASAPAGSYLFPCALLLAGMFLLYAGAYRYPLVFDDGFLNPVQLPDLASSCTRFANRCLANTTFGLTYLAAGLDLTWFRIGNVLIHAITALALFAFLDRLFQAVRWQADESGGLTASRDRLLAYCGAVLFAVHPVTVYAVAYLAQRSTLMATLFSLLALIAFVQAMQAGGRRWLWASLILYAMALGSKEHAVMVPAVAAAIAVLLRGRIPGTRIERMAFALVVAAVFAFITIRLSHVIGSAYEYYTRELETGVTAGPVNVYLASVATQTFLFFKYLLLWLIPYPGWMSVDLRQPVAASLFAWPQAVGFPAYLAYGAVAALLVLRRGTPGLLGLGLLFPWLLFFTEFATVRIQEPFVLYRSYLWMAGLPLALPYLAKRLSARWIMGGCIVLALLCGVAMRERLMTFSSELTLWNDVVRKNTDLSLAFVDRGYNSRAVALMRAGRVDEALRDLEAALKLNPRSAHTYTNRAIALSNKGEHERALADFDRAIELDPSFAAAHSERCLVLLRMDRNDEALQSCNTALQIAPHLLSTLLNRSIIYLRMHRLPEALGDVEGVLRFEPASALALYNRGRIYREMGRGAESERDFRASCKAGLTNACATLR